MALPVKVINALDGIQEGHPKLLLARGETKKFHLLEGLRGRL